ncbi:MAG: bifunctional diaminohydroxyphosphoribosylaminopyrimidine deaminase/5-amino-6-(5-phosphoribosylamino)uracil reductase RibD [Flavisolibacter sp.]
MTSHETYMHRCLELALLGCGQVAPNPMVGALLVHDNKIIGEGYHRQYGKSHAEVNCIQSVNVEHLHLIERSTMYVSLEPCAHFGKTPPCADLIIKKKIPNVVIGCRDPFIYVNGKGIEKLKSAGVKVEVGILEKECIELNRRFFLFNTERRPYVILKWAQSSNAKISSADRSRLLISNEYSNRMVHKWRSEEMAIMVGTNTALMDDPELSTRLWPGNHPIRLVVDMDLRLPKALKLFDPGIPTIVFNIHQHSLPEKAGKDEIRNAGTSFYQVTNDVSLISQVSNALYQLGIQSVLVEGGSYLLQSFIDEDAWDEARVITNEELVINEGLHAPVLKNHKLKTYEQILSDTIRTFTHS